MPSLIQKHAHVKGQRSNHHIFKFQPNPSWAKKRPNRYTSFVGITKKTWADAYMAHAEDDPAIDCFQNLDTALIPTHLTHWELPPQIENLESFVFHVYCKSGLPNLPELRWEMFRSRNLEGESLPPTQATIRTHIMRAKLHSIE